MPDHPAEDTAPEVTVEQVRAEAEKWAKHHRAEEAEHRDEAEPELELQHRAVAEAFEDMVRFIDHPRSALMRSLPSHVRALKIEHGGRQHG